MTVDVADYARNLAVLAGREPSADLCRALESNLQIFAYLVIETATYGEPTERDVIEAIAAGPVAAAELFRAARRERLTTATLQASVEIFMRTIGFEYPHPETVPEDAAVEIARALDHAVAEARRIKKAKTGGRPKGHQADILNIFIDHLLTEISPNLPHEQRIELIGTALLMAVHIARACIDRFTDLLPPKARNAALARLSYYEKIDEGSIIKRVARILKTSACQDGTPDANRTRTRI